MFITAEILPAILKLFQTGSNLRQSHNEQRDAALAAIYMACTETKLYATDWESTGKRNRKREEIGRA